MRVVVHIGTHKTGTTSIQHFCASNRGELLRRGIYYPLSRYSPRNLNWLASQVARGHRDEAKTFLMRTVKAAANRGADRILMSAESLYAMTVQSPNGTPERASRAHRQTRGPPSDTPHAIQRPIILVASFDCSPQAGAP